MLRSRLFWRNFFSYLLIICLSTVVISYQLTLRTEKITDAEASATLKQLLNFALSSINNDFQWTPEELDWKFTVTYLEDLRITVIDASGLVLFESQFDRQKMENHRDRPEVLEADVQGFGEDTRRSATLGTTMKYMAKRVETGDSHVYLRIGLPLSHLEDRLKDQQEILLTGALAGAFFAICAAFLLVRRITKPISDITQVAESISQGNYDARVKDLQSNELGTLGEAINRLAAAIQANIHKRESMENTKREFTSNISHELKTPLTSIKGYVETLQDGAWEDRAYTAKFLTIIHSNVDRIISLVNDLMSLATIEASDGLFALEAVDWQEIVEEVFLRQEISCQKKAIKLSFEAPSEKILVMGNKRAMTHILDNLVQNAINYTPSGGQINVSVSSQNRKAIMKVSDTGIGISQQDQWRIFERFYRVDKARSRDMGGTGLGLAIVKHLVMQIQGTIKVDSELYKGSTFIVSLAKA